MRKLFFLIFAFFLYVLPVHAQLWSGLIDPARATDWTHAGLIDASGNPVYPIPSLAGGTTWTQCSNTQCAAVTSAWPNATGAQINSALANAPNNTFVFLPAGTDNITDVGLTIQRSNVELRGAGANQTFLVFAAGVVNSCGGGYPSAMCMNGSGGAYWVTDPGYDWTAGYSQGTSTLNLSSTAVIVAGQSIVGVDQCSFGLSGNPCNDGSNEGPDNGNWFDCDIKYTAPFDSTHQYHKFDQVTYLGNYYQNIFGGTTPIGTVPTNATYWTLLGVAVNATFGCAVNGPDASNQRLKRPQSELFLVKSIPAPATCPGGVGPCITVFGSLRSPNWSSARTPRVYIGNTVRNSGVVNLSIDLSANVAPPSNRDGIVMFYVANSWVHGVRIVNPGFSGIYNVLGVHNLIEQNYIYRTYHGLNGGDIYGINSAPTSDNLIQANIVQWDLVCWGSEGPDTGTVWGYNFCINDWNGNGGINNANFPHAGDRWNLFEGNEANGFFAENFHGPKIAFTHYRNFFTGWESCANSSVCGSATFKGGGGNGTTPYRQVAFSRYQNAIANVLGTPGYANCYTSTTPFADACIFTTGEANGLIPNDPVSATSFYRWSNYDVVNGAVQCNNSEVPTAIAVMPQPLPTVGCGGTALPASLYLTGKPLWFGSLAYPSVHPESTGGNVGQCTGTWGIGVANVAGQYGGVAASRSSQCTGTSLAVAWGGHVDTNPAMNCFLNIMNGPPDGSNTSPLSFNADVCYANFFPIATFTPSSPVNVGLVPQNLTSNPVSETLQNIGTATLTNTAINLSSNLFTIVNNTCGSPATITNLIPGTGFTLAPNATCTFQVTASPTAVGLSTANLVFVENTATGSDTLVLNATGTGPPAPTTVMSAGKFATHVMCPVRADMTQLCFAEDCNCWWVSMSGAAYTPFGVTSVNGQTGNVVLSIK